MSGLRISVPRFVVVARKSQHWIAFKEKANAWALSKNGEKVLSAILTIAICWAILWVIFQNLPVPQ